MDGVLADLGVSSLQLDSPGRGFGFSREGPLDMRMGSSAETARDYLMNVDPAELERVLREAGEERFAGKLARRLKEDAPLFHTTADLAAAVARWIPRRGKSHPATRVFLALRMAVNQEMRHLSDFLERAPSVLKPGGRLVVITFHSTEDRLVKRYWKDHWNPGPMRAVSKKVLIASAEERRVNPRSRSAKLRVFEKTPELPSG
jgi:16S rRNA (cytosine1402-N4)-methyltransferase